MASILISNPMGEINAGPMISKDLTVTLFHFF